MRAAEHTADDRRVRRTKRQLRGALLGLILERGWDAVRIQDVCRAADVGRSTFYLHFADKEDLLLSGFDDLLEELVRARQGKLQPLSFVEPLVLHASQNLSLFRKVAGSRSGHEVIWRFKDVVSTVVERELTELKVAKTARPIVARFVAGGISELIFGWLEKPSGVSAETLASRCQNLALSAIAGVKRAP
ncbi:MAG: TetR/AcrR family transcriptional regulator [Myxococcota bacterium]